MRLTLSVLLLLDAALLPAAEIVQRPAAIPSLTGLRVQAVNAPALEGAAAALPAQAPELAAPALLPPAAAQAAAGAQIQQASAGVSAALDAIGPMSEAAAEDASGAGDKIEKALEGAPKPADAPLALPAPAAQKALPAPAAAAPAEKDLTPEQLQKLRALKFVVSLYTEHYAPRTPWKTPGRGVDFMTNYRDVRAQVVAKPDMTQSEFRRLLRRFVEGSQDFHAGISFYSTEASKLPVTIMAVQGRYFIYDVDRDALPESQFPYKMGDEVLSFDGKPVAEVVASLKPAVENVRGTDEILAAMSLTARSGRKAMDVPQGKAALKIQTADGAVHDVALDWVYQPELIPQDVPPNGEVLGPEVAPDPSRAVAQPPLRQGPIGVLAQIKKLVREFLAPMAHPDAALFADSARNDRAHGMTIAAKKSFVPELGKILWPATPREKAAMERLPFHAYIYENEHGEKIGYIRVPDYMADDQPQAYAQVFAQLVAKFEKDTDALVFDQINNPGGNMFYMYTLLSMLTDKPLAVPQHLMMLDQSDGKLAAQIIKQAEQPSLAQLLRRAIADEMVAFQAPHEEENPIVKFARYILNRLKRAQDEKNGSLRLTDPIDLFGVGQIDPQPMVHYTKPLVVLTNELDFSAADFLPAILQDNGRATIFGARTAGAGGAVKSLQWPNQFGIDTISYTWTLAIRTIGQVLENLGVTPNAPYAVTPQDLRDGFQGYKKALNDAAHSKIVSSRIVAKP